MTKKRIIILIVIAIILLGAAGYGLYIMYTKANSPVPSEGSGKPSVSEQVDASLSKGDAKGAHSIATEAYKSNPTTENARLVAQTGLASEDYQGVIDFIHGRTQADLTYKDYQDLGSAYESMGNKQQAVAAYRKAAETWPKDDTAYDAETTYLLNHANALEGKTNDF